jgi:acyl-coenzyme A thioesterase PaaI-like protein
LRDVHCNSRGFVHGGVIAALADNAMGLSFVRVFKATVEDPAHPATGAVTVGLGVDYVATAKLGQWLQIEPRVVKAGRSLGFVDALITADGEVVARANATFRLTS